MKVSVLLYRRVIVAALSCVSSLLCVYTQGVEIQSGCRGLVATAPIQTHLVATLLPAHPKSEAGGCIKLQKNGDVLMISGRLAGLDGNKSYRLFVEPPAPIGGDGNNLVVGFAHGAKKSVVHSTVFPDGDMGTLTVDASGGVEARVSLKGAGVTEGWAGILGRVLVLAEVSATGISGAPVLVARGTVVLPKPPINPEQHSSRLDEIGPGERWF